MTTAGFRGAVRLALCVASIACRPVVAGGPVPSSRMIVCDTEECRAGQDVEVTYLGVGGFMVRSNEKVLLTAPHYTSPAERLVAKDLLGGSASIRPDTALIRRLFPEQAKSARTILVGHGHYDHLLDVPFIADSLAKEATVYGGPSVINMLMGDRGLRPDLVAIAGKSVGTSEVSGDWITSPDGGFRFMALKSSHAPAYRLLSHPFNYSPGTVDTAYTTLPQHATDWKVGEPYAYIIDVLNASGAPVFRIYYQDSASDWPLGFPPPDLGAPRIDLAIVCVPSSQYARSPAPDSLISRLNPRYVIASHWEHFFSPQTEAIRRNPTSDFGAFEGSMTRTLPKDAEWSMPYPGDRYRFRGRP